MSKQTVYICNGRWCSELGSKRIFEKVKAWFQTHDSTTTVEECRCLGYCEQGVNAMKQGKIYHELTEENAVDTLTKQAGRERGSVDINLQDDFLGDL